MKERVETLKKLSRQLVIFAIIFAFILPKTTVFAAERTNGELARLRVEAELGSELVSESGWKTEPEELPEIEPYYFDPTMLPQLGEFAISDFNYIAKAPLVDMSLVSTNVNELTEPSAEVLTELLYAQGIDKTIATRAFDLSLQSEELPPLIPTPEIALDLQYIVEAELALIDAFEQSLETEETFEAEGFNVTAAPAPPLFDDIISNPFALQFNANESIQLNTGAAVYRVNILNIPGRNGFDLNLSMLYDSTTSSLSGPWHSSRTSMHPNFNGLGAGWSFDLPHIYDSVLHLPGRGSFAIHGYFGLNVPYTYRLIGHFLNDMSLHRDFSFRNETNSSNRRLDFYDGTSYFFGGHQLIGKRDRFGNTIRFEYFSNTPEIRSQLRRIIDSNGKTISFTLQVSNENYRSLTITAPDQSTFSINMSTAEVPGNEFSSARSFLLIDSVTNQVGAVTTFAYDVTRFYHLDGPELTSGLGWRPNYLVLLRQVTYPSGAVLRYDYGSHMGRAINWDGGPVFQQQIFRVQSRVLFSNGGREYSRTTFSYFNDHFISSTRWVSGVTYGVTVTENNGLQTVYTFDGGSHLNLSQHTYNAAGVLLSETFKSFHRRLPTVINTTEHRGGFSRYTIQEFAYNDRGQVIRAISPLANWSTHERYRTDYTFDDRFGLLLTRTTRPDARTTVVARNTLCPEGKVIVRTDVYENNVRRTRTDFLHDGFGNVTEIRQFPNVNAAGFIQTQIIFDSATMPRTIRTTEVRDANGVLSGGNGIVERHFTYDPMWRVSSETDPNGYVTRWQYDGVGRVTRVTFPNGGYETYAYDDKQNILSHRTVLGAVYTHQFDMLGNLLTIIDLDGVVIRRNTYDNRMRLVETENASGIASSQRTVFGYDILDRVTETRHLTPDGLTMFLETVNYYDVYDAAGNMRITTTTHGNANAPNIVIFSQYDRFGRITQEGTIGGKIVSYTHDLAGRVTREQSLGVDNTFTHNIFGVTAVQNISGRVSRSTYDALGRLLTVSDFAGNVQRISYDALGRLISHRTPFERIGNAICFCVTRITPFRRCRKIYCFFASF